MTKFLKSSSGHHLSQNFWRIFRNIAGRKLWKLMYIFSQKRKIPNLISILKDRDLNLISTLNYPNVNSNNNQNKLNFSEIIKKYNTSKPGGEYRNYLDNLFLKIRPQTKTILEVGISHAGGLLAMRDFFENSLLWGVDIDKDTFIETDRVQKCDWVDQLKLETLEENAKNFFIKFDLIIDDGWHHPESQINTLIAYLPYLNTGGTYILEDIVHNEYFKYFNEIKKILEKKNFSCDYLNFEMHGSSEISDNLGYLIIKRL